MIISIQSPGNSEPIKTYEVELNQNEATTYSDRHYWTKDQVPAMNGPMTVTAVTDNGLEKSVSVSLPPVGKRQFEQISITVAKDRLIVGKIQN